MRWDLLFADLEGQLAHAEAADDRAVLGEEELHRAAAEPLRDRLATLAGAHREVRVVLHGGEALELRLASAGEDWVAGAADRVALVIPLCAVASVIVSDSPGPAAGPGLGASASRASLTAVLRDLARRGERLEVMLASGAVGGRVVRVGRDHLELREGGDERVRSRLVPFAAIRCIRC
ncbi:hypothetical protein [Homoserinibacter sp. GY 40078]|uniref:hypothetical protein n=1 Tax=Homoserinibacter sp. GY 40078 TaxID=2603275 RepID=UPI0011CA2ABE|nr:hypothetical protein [Homoserinibacter sp. GY 40078]TXK16300.1 hypothetical protein FVQ89_13670 [Homoserinibacter sp. GY 40078]